MKVLSKVKCVSMTVSGCCQALECGGGKGLFCIGRVRIELGCDVRKWVSRE